MDRDCAHADDLRRAQLATDEGLAVASAALTLVEANSRLLGELLTLVERHGAILERLAGLHDRGAMMVPPGRHQVLVGTELGGLLPLHHGRPFSRARTPQPHKRGPVALGQDKRKALRGELGLV